MPLGAVDAMTCHEPYSCKANLKRLRKPKAPPVRTTDGALLPSIGGRPETSSPPYKRALWGNGSGNKEPRSDGLAPLLPLSRGGADEAERGSLQAPSRRSQYCLQIEGRAADDLQHLSGRCLLLKRFLQLSCPRLHLVEQADVVDRNDRLIRKACEQGNLLGRERLYLGAIKGERTQQLVFLEQRHAKPAPHPEPVDGSDAHRLPDHVGLVLP